MVLAEGHVNGIGRSRFPAGSAARNELCDPDQLFLEIVEMGGQPNAAGPAGPLLSSGSPAAFQPGTTGRRRPISPGRT
jgi:hypothetical protein